MKYIFDGASLHPTPTLLLKLWNINHPVKCHNLHVPWFESCTQCYSAKISNGGWLHGEPISQISELQKMGWTVAQGWVLAWCAVYCVSMLTICNANVYPYMVHDCGLLGVMCLCVYDFVCYVYYDTIYLYHILSLSCTKWLEYQIFLKWGCTYISLILWFCAK